MVLEGIVRVKCLGTLWTREAVLTVHFFMLKQFVLKLVNEQNKTFITLHEKKRMSCWDDDDCSAKRVFVLKLV